MKVSVPDFFKSVKYFLGTLNCMFLITGITLAITGSAVLAIYSEYEDLITRRFTALPSFVIATGIIIVLASVLGFYAAYSKQLYFIVGYVVMLIVVLIFELTIVFMAYNLKDNVVSEIRPVMAENLKLYTTRIEVARLWDDLHSTFECCGAQSRLDFISTAIPVSCCHIDYGQISPFLCGTTNAYTIGCAEALGEWLSFNALVVAIVGLIVTCWQIPITLCASWLAWRAKTEDIELES